MKRIGMTWRVDPEKWDEYKNIHQHPWPELIEALQSVGIHNYCIYAFGMRMFAHMEVGSDDPDQAMAQLQQTLTMKRWNEKVLPWVQPEAEDGTGIQFMELEQIFYCP
jgi:L-rhamnose mutarotase